MSVPKLRFKEFDGEWTKYKIAEVTEYLVDGTHFSPKSTDGEFKYITSKNIRNDGLDLTNISYISKDEHESIYKRCKVQLGDILLTKDGANTGNCCLNTLDEEFSLLSSVAVLRGKNQSFDNNFILQILQSDLGQNTIVSSMSGQAITRITLTKLKDYSFNFPEFKEQTKIASFLSAVDEKISQLTQKHQLLSQYKQCMMQKLFSQQIRFKADDGSEFTEWEQSLLGQHCQITTGKLDANAMKEDGQYRFYTCAKDYYFIDIFAFDTEALLISGNGAHVGYIHYYKGKFNAYQRTYVLDNWKHNIQFVKYFLAKYLKSRIYSEKKEGNTPYIVLATLSEMPFQAPCLEEQTKIANFLSAIDQKIDVVSEQLEQAKLWKKGLLQQMFV